MNIRFRIVVVVAVLLCALAALEFPELVRLSDDTSNDFSFTVSKEADVVVAKQNASAQPVELAVRTAASWPPPEGSRSYRSLSSPSDLLPLLCIHRT